MKPYEGYKLYGPYIHWRTKRKVVYLRMASTNERIYLNYARYLMETHLGERIPQFHDVHHVNGDVTDDRIENLAVVHTSIHNSDHAKAKTKRDGLGHWTEQ